MTPGAPAACFEDPAGGAGDRDRPALPRRQFVLQAASKLIDFGVDIG